MSSTPMIAQRPQTSPRPTASKPERLVDFRCRWLTTPEAMEAIGPQWERLMDTAIRSNLMFDPDYLIPLIKQQGDASVRILIVEATSQQDRNAPPVLCGLVPLQKKRIYGMPLKGFEIWRNDQCLDDTPLLKAGVAHQTLACLFDFLENQERTSLLSFDLVSSEGEFARVLTDVLNQRGIVPFYRDAFTRAAFRPEADAATYMAKHVSKSVKKTCKRLKRRLAEQGEVTYTCYRDATQAASLIDKFLELEASGWKGEAGTALACDRSNREFFREMATRSLKKGKLSMMALNLNGTPIAMICDFYRGEVGYCYKTAFDATMKKFSPGVMLELRNIEYMHQIQVTEVDSCTAPDNATINRMWGGRTGFQGLVIPLRGRTARWATTLMPWMQQIKRTLKR